jgi:hypothetical protein
MLGLWFCSTFHGTIGTDPEWKYDEPRNITRPSPVTQKSRKKVSSTETIDGVRGGVVYSRFNRRLRVSVMRTWPNKKPISAEAGQLPIGRKPSTKKCSHFRVFLLYYRNETKEKD